MMITLKKSFILIALFIVIGIGLLLPLALVPFVNVLPHLYTFTYGERMLFSFLATAVMLFTFAITPKYKGPGKSPKAGGGASLTSILFFLFLTSLGAGWLSPNSFGAMVKIFATDPYFGRFQIVESKVEGGKYAATKLTLRSEATSKIYFLTLSKKLFGPVGLQNGQVVLLTGKQNILGAYVEKVERR